MRSPCVCLKIEAWSSQTVCSPLVNIQSTRSFLLYACLNVGVCDVCGVCGVCALLLCDVFSVRPNHSHAKRLGTRPASLLFHGLLASKEPVAVVLRSCPSETLKPFGSSRPSVLCPSLQARSFHGITASASRQAQTALSAQEPSEPPHLWLLAPPASSTCH